MNIWHKYLDGWTYALRVIAFIVLLQLVLAPLAIGFMAIDGIVGDYSNVICAILFFIYTPFAVGFLCEKTGQFMTIFSSKKSAAQLSAQARDPL